MRLSGERVGFGFILLTVLLLSDAVPMLKASPQAQDQQQQQSTGPKPKVDETVIAPKKAQPSPAVQPENKPEKINPNEIYSISTSSNLVNLDVLVEDKDGNPISSLGRKNFKLYDDGVAQTITNFATSEAPIITAARMPYASAHASWSSGVNPSPRPCPSVQSKAWPTVS